MNHKNLKIERMKKFLIGLLVMVAATACSSGGSDLSHGEQLFNDGWKFQRLSDKSMDESREFAKASYDDSKWESVSLPHTANIEKQLICDEFWQGICWYRKDFAIENYSKQKSYILEFEGAMNKMEISLNGELIKEYQGGYLPVVIDLTSHLKSGINTIAVRLDNQNNIETGPKPYHMLDFCMFSGIYRNVRLYTKNSVRISNSILADRVAGGGTFVTYEDVSKASAKVKVAIDVENVGKETSQISIIANLLRDGEQIASAKAENVYVAAGKYVKCPLSMDVQNPALWSPESPNLYKLQTIILNAEGERIDKKCEKIGIREFKFVGNDLYINGVKTFLRGTNRHQEYPFVGYAVSDNAHYRDAKKIKDGGFDYVRLSHYPHSRSFMEACDELGLVVLDAIMGWQYYSKEDVFREFCFDQTRRLIRRDRNHPSVLAWEASLNETAMPEEFMDKLDDIVHEEFPGENVYSAGWKFGEYDIYLQARQHRILHKDDMTFERPYMVSEYGDWEYHSMNAGLNQHQQDRMLRAEKSSRQLRGQGEAALLQQAYNLQESHNDNLRIPAYGDGYWVMFDYNRGVSDDIESSGVMDVFRLPKFSYEFYRSQRAPTAPQGAMVSIASYWEKDSATDVKVFSNCDEVELKLNGKVVARKKADNDKNSSELSYPPFTFKVGKFTAGELRATGYIKDQAAAEDVVRSATRPARLSLKIDEGSRPAQSGCNDILFIYISATDISGTVISKYDKKINITLPDGVELINPEPIVAEAGIATALVRITGEAGTMRVTATSEDGLKGALNFNVK